MFNIVINNAPLVLKSRMMLYAEDSKVIGPASTLEDTSQLRKDPELSMCQNAVFYTLNKRTSIQPALLRVSHFQCVKMLCFTL